MNQYKHQYKNLAVALCLLLGIVGFFVLYLSWPFITGKTIVLATRPVDPFDILRGQYIMINYEISRLPAIAGAHQGDNVFIVVEENDSVIWQHKEASLAKPESTTFIKGEVKSISNGNMQIEYGIEQYFFERSAEFLTNNMTVAVKVDNSGNARIMGLLQNGKPLEIKYKKPGLTS